MESLILIPLLFVAITPVLVGLAQYNVLAGLRRQARRAWTEVESGLRQRRAVLAAVLETAPSTPDIAALALRLKESHPPSTDGSRSIAARNRDEADLAEACRPIISRLAAFDSDALRELRRADAWLREAVKIHAQSVDLYHHRIGKFPGSLLAPRFGFSPLPTFVFHSVFDFSAEPLH